MWRAVEVHVFLDDPPPPPPHTTPEPACPGGGRYRKWSVSTPIGFSASPAPGAVVAGNIVIFRKDEGKPEIRVYFCPALGAGVSYSGPKLSALWGWLKAIFTGLNISELSWSTFTASTPFNFGDLEDATCQINSAGAGLVKGYQKATVSVYGKVWFRDSNGKCMFATKDFCSGVDTSGKDIQVGIGGSVVGGPLFRID